MSSLGFSSTKALAALIAAVGIGAAACGSSSSGSPGGSAPAVTPTAGGSSPSAGSTPSGTPIKLGMIADVNTAVNYGDGVAGAKAAVRGVNARGGIDGHPVQLVFCNGNLNPNTDGACVRQMISDKVMAMVGTEYVSYEETGDQLFAKAGIANVGPVAYGYGTSDPNGYLLESGQQFLNAAQAEAAVKYGGKRVGLVRVDIPTTVPFVPALQKALPLVGGTYAGQVAISEPGTDFAPPAAALEQDKPDAITTDGTEGADAEVFKEMSGLGFTGPEVVAQDALSLATVKVLGPLANKLYFVSNFPPISAASTVPGLAQYKTDMAAELASGDKNAANYLTYNRDVALDAYFSVIAVQKIADAAGSSDASSFETAIKAAKNVNLGGVIPPWTPNKSISSVVTRTSNGALYISRWQNGSQHLLTPKPIDVTKLVDQTNQAAG